MVKDLVLIGGGHSHVIVLKNFGMNKPAGVRLTLICRDAHTPYSGMLPGLIAGHYGFDDCHIDLARLARFAGARLINTEATDIDTANRLVMCRDRPPVAFDLASINIGSTPVTATTPGAAENVVPVKPVNRFVAHWERLQQRVMARTAPTRIGVVGSGAAGVELLLAVQYRMGLMLAAEGRDAGLLEFHLITEDGDILITHNRSVRARMRRILAERGVHLHTGLRVDAVAPGEVRSNSGQAVELDEILWVTRAGAAGWIGAAGLEVDGNGFMRVADTLESVSHPGIFGAGDIAAMVNHPRPKSGVFAVRQGPPLARNLRRALLNRPLRRFRPQKKFLSLISTGDKYAVASRGFWSLEGRAVWWWKDRIDMRFMNTFNRLPQRAGSL